MFKAHVPIRQSWLFSGTRQMKEDRPHRSGLQSGHLSVHQRQGTPGSLSASLYRRAQAAPAPMLWPVTSLPMALLDQGVEKCERKGKGFEFFVTLEGSTNTFSHSLRQPPGVDLGTWEADPPIFNTKFSQRQPHASRRSRVE